MSVISNPRTLFTLPRLPTPQKVDEEIMKALKLSANDDLDLDAHDKYFETAFDTESRKQSYIVAARKCYHEVTVNLPAIISKYEAAPFNIKRDTCNIKFMAVSTCVQVEAHLVSCQVVVTRTF